MRLDPFSSAPDIDKLDQIVRLNEMLLSSEAPTHEIAMRVCQSAVHAVGVADARLVALPGDGTTTVVAQYGRATFPELPADTLARALAAGMPALLEDTVPAVLDVPLRCEGGSMLLQLLAGGAAFTLEQIEMARYVGSLAVAAFRQRGARSKLARAVEARSEVLIALAHDLRTPLNAVIGYTQLLMEDSYGPCNEAQRDVLGTIERQALDLLSMLGGALDMARLDAESEPPRQDEFSLDEVLRELCTGASARRAQNGVRLAWSVDPAMPPIRSDRFRVRQILQNLVENALRFTDHGDVSVDALPHQGGVRLIVSDTGTGIERAQLPYLFEPFRAGGSERSGTGCGLYLVKRFSESLGGRVAVDSTPGIGTRFTVDLPQGGAATL
jgi:signal transduction histidine kinase